VNHVSTIPNPEGPAKTGGTAMEKHLSPEQLGELWGLSADTVRKLMEGEPGVLVIQNTGRARRYRTFRIPESVAARVHRKLTNPVGIRR
jgi:hypothetical protein